MSSGDTGSELQGPNAKLGCNLIYVKIECVSKWPVSLYCPMQNSDKLTMSFHEAEF